MATIYFAPGVLIMAFFNVLTGKSVFVRLWDVSGYF